MSEIDYDQRDPFDDYERDPDNNIQCNRCGQRGLSWHHTGVRWRLMDQRGRLHVCPPVDASDDFEVV